MEWIYHIEDVRFPETPGTIKDSGWEQQQLQLDRLGKDGWEAVGTLPPDINRKGVFCILFKKHA